MAQVIAGSHTFTTEDRSARVLFAALRDVLSHRPCVEVRWKGDDGLARAILVSPHMGVEVTYDSQELPQLDEDWMRLLAMRVTAGLTTGLIDLSPIPDEDVDGDV